MGWSRLLPLKAMMILLTPSTSFMKEVEATKGDLASIRSENVMFRSIIEEFTSSSTITKHPPVPLRNRSDTITPMNLFKTNVSFADVESSAKQQGKQPIDYPATGISNHIGPPPGFEQLRVEPRVIDIQIRLENRIKELEVIINRIPRVPAPPKMNHPQSFADSPFVKSICLTAMPSKFTFPTIKTYDRTSDPDGHIAHYKQRMQTITIHHYQREVCMCKSFGSSLAGLGLQWFIRLPNDSISTFTKLHHLFVEQFSSTRKIEKQSDDLYFVK